MSRKKSVSIIGTVGLPAQYGGWETLTEHLVLELEDRFDFTVYCSAPHYEEKSTHFSKAKLKYIRLKANGIQSIPYDIFSMLHAIKYSDYLLVLGVSGCIFLPVLRLLTNKPVVVNIDGLEWKRDKWGILAKWFLKLSEATAIRYADRVITDNKAIQTYVFEEYGKTSDLISYGGDHVEKITDIENVDIYPFVTESYSFTVCRIEPENNIHIILEAFEQSDLTLVIVGNWNNSQYGKQLKAKYLNADNIYLIDPIYNPEKLNFLRCHCSIYIHGHSAGGTNPSLVEAMSLGLAIVAFDVIYNRETTRNNACYFKGAAELIMTVNLLLVDDERRNAFGKSMYNLATNYYRWENIANQYAVLLNQIDGKK